MSGRSTIGVDAGGTKLLAGVVDDRMEVADRVLHVWRENGREAVIERMVDAVEALRVVAPGAEAVGFGLPSLIDFASGTSLSSVHLPLDGVPFRDLMAERLGMPVYVDNDANLATLAEQRIGAARGAEHVVMLTLGTGIGGGLVLGGRVYRGSTGAGAELGHMTVDLDGPPCLGNCPNRGCLEVMASGTAIGVEGMAEAAREPGSALGAAVAGGTAVTGALVTALAIDGDQGARTVLETIGERLGAGLVSIVNAFNPEVIVIGGGAAAGGDLLLEPARRVVAERALPGARGSVRVVQAAFGEEAGMLGAALFALAGGDV
jgi:glucokinase